MKEIFLKITVDEKVDNVALLRDIKEFMEPHDEEMIIQEIDIPDPMDYLVV